MSLMRPSGGASPPPWQVLVLVANHIDPKTLAIASCVCKSWFISMSSDHLWQPNCSTHFPSLSNLHSTNSTCVPYHRLYALGRISAKRRLQKPRKPHLSLSNLIFTIDVHNNDSRVSTIVKLGSELSTDRDGVFRFDIDVDDEKILVGDADLGGLRLAWNVVLEGFKGVFTMMECRGRGSDRWFSEELPSPGCCSGVGTSGLVADLRLGLGGKGGESGSGGGGGGGKMVVEKVGVGVLSIVSWRYVSVDDALRYLQHFLMPSYV